MATLLQTPPTHPEIPLHDTQQIVESKCQIVSFVFYCLIFFLGSSLALLLQRADKKKKVH